MFEKKKEFIKKQKEVIDSLLVKIGLKHTEDNTKKKLIGVLMILIALTSFSFTSYGQDLITDIKKKISNIEEVEALATITITAEGYLSGDEEDSNNINNYKHIYTGDITNHSKLGLSFNASEDITGLTLDDIIIEKDGTQISASTNGHLSSGSGDEYSYVFTPTEDAEYKISIVAGNANHASNPFTWTYDSTAPTLIITKDTALDSDLKAGDTVTFTFAFHESVSDFTIYDIGIQNGTAVGELVEVTPSLYASEYTLEVTPASDTDGNIVVKVIAGRITDSAGNSNTEVTYAQSIDTQIPGKPEITFKAGEDDYINSSEGTITLEVSLPAGTVVGDTIIIQSPEGEHVMVYKRHTVTEGDVTKATVDLDVLKSMLGEKDGDYPIVGIIEDAAGNRSGESIEEVIILDIQAPSLSGANPSDLSTGVASTANIVFTFNEPIRKGTGTVFIKKAITDNVVESFDIASSNKITITGGHVLTIDPSSSFESSTAYYLVIPNTAILDLAGNPFAGTISKETMSFTTADIENPSLVISNDKTGTVKAGEEITYTFTFSEEVYFIKENITLIPGQDGAGSLAKTGTSTYEFKITPFEDGPWEGILDLQVKAGAVSYQSGNKTETTVQHSQAIDTIIPTINIVEPNTSPETSKTITATTDSDATLMMSQLANRDIPCDETKTFTTYANTELTSEGDNGKVICFKATDDAGNISHQPSNEIAGIDTTAPIITLIGEATIEIEEGDIYADAGATASDNTDGHITNRIQTIDPVDLETVGSYTISYNVSDSAGNNAVEVIRTVNVIPIPPVHEIATIASSLETIRGTNIDLIPGTGNIARITNSTATDSKKILAIYDKMFHTTINTDTIEFILDIKPIIHTDSGLVTTNSIINYINTLGLDAELKNEKENTIPGCNITDGNMDTSAMEAEEQCVFQLVLNRKEEVSSLFSRILSFFTGTKNTMAATPDLASITFTVEKENTVDNIIKMVDMFNGITVNNTNKTKTITHLTDMNSVTQDSAIHLEEDFVEEKDAIFLQKGINFVNLNLIKYSAVDKDLTNIDPSEKFEMFIPDFLQPGADYRLSFYNQDEDTMYRLNFQTKNDLGFYPKSGLELDHADSKEREIDFNVLCNHPNACDKEAAIGEQYTLKKFDKYHIKCTSRLGEIETSITPTDEFTHQDAQITVTFSSFKDDDAKSVSNEAYQCAPGMLRVPYIYTEGSKHSPSQFKEDLVDGDYADKNIIFVGDFEVGSPQRGFYIPMGELAAGEEETFFTIPTLDQVLAAFQDFDLDADPITTGNLELNFPESLHFEDVHAYFKDALNKALSKQLYLGVGSHQVELYDKISGVLISDGRDLFTDLLKFTGSKKTIAVKAKVLNGNSSPFGVVDYSFNLLLKASPFAEENGGQNIAAPVTNVDIKVDPTITSNTNVSPTIEVTPDIIVGTPEEEAEELEEINNSDAHRLSNKNIKLKKELEELQGDISELDDLIKMMKEEEEAINDAQNLNIDTLTELGLKGAAFKNRNMQGALDSELEEAWLEYMDLLLTE